MTILQFFKLYEKLYKKANEIIFVKGYYKKHFYDIDEDELDFELEKRCANFNYITAYADRHFSKAVSSYMLDKCNKLYF